MRKITFLLALILFVGMNWANAQTKTIHGTVVSSEDGQGIPGVTVAVKGTTVGTTTDLDGKFSLDVKPEFKTLQFSYVGMKTVDIALSGQTEINVTMEPDVMQMDEVVVTALGISREKKSLGYAVQEVKGEDLNRGKSTNVINAMSGKVAGVQITNNTNMGGGSNVVIRGATSLTGNNQALFIVDGIPIVNVNANDAYQQSGRSGYDYGSPVNDINPADIESVTVLKGGAATALYGSRAANGVILITTKKGTRKKGGLGKNFRVEYNNSTLWHSMDKSTFPKYQQNYGEGYGPYYSGPLAGETTPTDYTGLYHYDFDGDGTLDYVTPTTEDASMGSHFDPNLMAFQWDAFYPELPTYMKKSPYVMGANGPDYFFKTGYTMTNSLAVSSGSDHGAFRLAYTNTSIGGIMPNASENKNILNISGSTDVGNKITVSAAVNYYNIKTVGRNHTGYSDNILSSFRQWFNLGVDMKEQEDYYNMTGKNITWNPVSENNLNPIYWDNPYWQRYENYQSDVKNRVMGFAKADWDILEGLKFTAKYSLDTYSYLIEERKAVGSVAGEFGVGRPDVQSGYARKTLDFTETNFDMMLKYNKYLTEDFNINLLAGSNFRRTSLEEVYVSTNGGLAVPGTYALSNSASPMLPPVESYEPVGVNGYFGSLSLGWKNMLYLDGTYRYDVSSTLPVDNRAYGYYGASLGFIFSELIHADWLNHGKVRFSYSQIGNDAPWGSTANAYNVVAPFGNVTLASMQTIKKNPDLLPEISSTVEGGLEMNMFKNRIRLDLSLYKTNTVNAIIPISRSTATGYRAEYKNIGEMENRGVEIALGLTAVSKKNFTWDINFNWSTNKNKVISLGEGIDNLQLARLQGGISINAREGETYGVIQGTDFVYAPDGSPIVQGNGYYMKTSTSDKVIGNITPDWMAGMNNVFTFGNFSASFLIDMRMGGSLFSLDQWYGMGTGLYAETDYTNDLGNPVRDAIYDKDGNELLPYIDLPGYDPANGYGANSGGMILDGVTWTDTNGDGVPNDGDEFNKNIRRTSALDYRVWGWSRNPNSKFVYDATFVKLREVTFNYNLPKKLFENNFIQSASIGLVGTNLWIMYKALPHADPEASQAAGNIQGWQSGVMPATRNYGFNLKINF